MNSDAAGSNRLSAVRRRMMLKKPVPELVAGLALPAVAAQLIMVIYNSADTVFVAGMGTCAAAAVGVVFALMSIIQSCGFGIGMGAKSIISRKLGEKRIDAASCCASSAFFFSLLLGGLLACGLFFLGSLLRLLGASPSILPYAADYSVWILGGAPIICGTFVLDDILHGEGQIRYATFGICAGGLLNVVLDPIFIFWLGLGISGAAIATLISMTVSFLLLLSRFLRGRSAVRISPALVSFRPGYYWLIITTGLPTVCRQGLGSASAAVLNVLASGYGDAAVAAVTIANKVYMFVRAVVLGIGQGMQPAFGFNFAAGDYGRVRKIFAFGTWAGTVFCSTAALLIAAGAGTVIGWFCPEPEVIAIGRPALLFGCAVMPALAFSTFVNQLSQVLGFRAEATVLACCRQGIFFFPACLLALGGIAGVAAIQPAADFCTFLAAWPYYRYFRRRRLPV